MAINRYSIISARWIVLIVFGQKDENNHQKLLFFSHTILCANRGQTGVGGTGGGEGQKLAQRAFLGKQPLQRRLRILERRAHLPGEKIRSHARPCGRAAPYPLTSSLVQTTFERLAAAMSTASS